MSLAKIRTQSSGRLRAANAFTFSLFSFIFIFALFFMKTGGLLG